MPRFVRFYDKESVYFHLPARSANVQLRTNINPHAHLNVIAAFAHRRLSGRLILAESALSAGL
jgi:hypothetical protein